ncbi:MAG: DUF721 domain-containing protein [Gammaproteobacteria bacterium]|nr:DUF721 domain-containing protein [Gammaproteobacteria bacterium]
MSTRTSRSIAKILEQVGKSDPAGLPVEARRLAGLERQVRACLPQELADHCHLAGIRDGCLRLVVDSPAWAARLRFQEPQLIRNWVRQGGGEIRRVQVRVAPQEQAPTPPARHLILTAESARLLEQTARGIADPGLAQALRRLARHGARQGSGHGAGPRR